jgi:hypothetical protein
MVNDIQGRIRDMIKNIYNEFLKVHKTGNRIHSKSGTVEFDGEDVLREKTGGLEGYVRYLKSVIADKNSFIRPELLDVVESVMETAAPKHVLTTLQYLSNNYLRTANDQVGELIDKCLIHSFGYFSANRTNLRANVDLPALLVRLRGVYTSSRSSDPDLLELRRAMEEIVKKAIEPKTPSVISAVRTACLLYMVARACTKNHYMNSTTREVA